MWIPPKSVVGKFPQAPRQTAAADAVRIGAPPGFAVPSPQDSPDKTPMSIDITSLRTLPISELVETARNRHRQRRKT